MTNRGSETQATRPEIGFVGVGNMGGAMSRNLLAKGFELRVYDRDPARADVLGALGAERVDDLSEVTPKDGIVISMVPDDAALEEIALSPGGILESIGGGIHLSTSTISPKVSKRLEELYAEAGATFLAATVLGRPDVAERGELTVFLAGDTGCETDCYARTRSCQPAHLRCCRSG